MRARGAIVERRACEFLENHGYKILAQNFQIKGGELDIVALKDSLVFVEVKHRSSSAFGAPSQMVTANKQRLLVRAAQVFLKKYPRFHNHPMRFDVIAALGTAESAKLEWIKNAIEVI